MAVKRLPAPTKLTPPRLLQSLARERLFEWLDAHRDRPGIWLGAQPGAGKTMLTAGYLQSRALPYLWYRLDTDDIDIGRFFGMLADAAAGAGIKVRATPFAAEHLTQPDAHARPWFRRLFALLPRPFVLVFDNLEQAALPWLPQVLGVALDEAPAGVTLLMTSRQTPPPALAPAGLGDALAILPPALLAFTEHEAVQYARSLGLDEGCVRAASVRVGGWAAGLRLLSHSPSTALPGASPEMLFDYFAGLLHDGLSAPGQHLLLVGALLPWIPAALLAEVAGVPDVVEQLEALCGQNLFTERVGRDAGVYRLHPLFREFLLERGRRALAPDERTTLLGQAQRGFVALGQVEAALDLALDAGDHAFAAGLWASIVEAKVALGHLDQLVGWYQRMPDTFLRNQPALLYGRARICFLREDSAALAHYAVAEAAFAAVGDLHGRQLCAAGSLEWSYNTDSFTGHQRWCELMARASTAESVCEEHGLRLLNGQLLACFFGGHFDVDAPAWVERVLALLTPGTCQNDKLSIAITLLGCLERAKRWDDAELLANRMEAMLDSASIGPRMKIMVRQQIAADLYRQTGRYDEARRLAKSSLTDATEHGFAVLAFEGIAILLLAAQYAGDVVETERLLGELATRVAAGSIYHQRFARQMRAWHELQRSRMADAREHADALRAAVEHSDMPAGFRATWLLMAVFVGFAEGRHQAACDELAGLCDQAEAGSRATLQVNLLSLQSWRHWRAGRITSASRDLTAALTLAADIRYYQLLAPLRTALAELAGFALQQGIAPAFARELIRRRRLAPPGPATTDWPWLLRITTFGRFTLQVDEVALVFVGKVPRKPLALLKALVAFGGHAVPQHRLTDALWPDDEADAAHDAFNVTLHRLRKLLGRGAEALVLQEGCVSLSPQLCWTDARAFECLTAPDASAVADSPGTRLPAPLQQALALYAGHFLAEDDDETWCVSSRERLRDRFKQAVVRHADNLFRAGRFEPAMACYRQGLDIDDLDEQFYQGVMDCALQLHRPAEGLAAYQRLKRMLSVLLGVAPSARSEALHRELRS